MRFGSVSKGGNGDSDLTVRSCYGKYQLDAETVRITSKRNDTKSVHENLTYRVSQLTDQSVKHIIMKT